jgi:hypothetical protein
MLSYSTSSSNNGADDITDDTSAPKVDNQPAVTAFSLNRMIEICSLNASSNGCSYTSHETCGFFVKFNNTLRLKESIVIVENQPEPTIKLVKISEGCETCTIGFIPRIYFRLQKVKNFTNGLLHIVLLYKDGTTYKKTRIMRIKAWRIYG